MANQLTVEMRHSISALKEKGWSQRRIARELGVGRETVRRYCAEATEAKPATLSTPGTEANGAAPPNPAPGSEGPATSAEEAGGTGRPSLCQGLARVIEAKLALGLSAQRIYPELNPKLAAFCRHYGTVLLPCLPRTPEHKGKVENSVGYVKKNALKARQFPSLQSQNEFLREWERTVADGRIHGTTRRQVQAVFTEEKPHLQPLPPDLFPCFREARRTVHRDSFVEVEKAYYAVPQEYIGCSVWARRDGREVRLSNERGEQLRLYCRLEPGRFSESLGVGGGRGSLQANLDYWLQRAGELGEPVSRWAQGLVEQRGPAAIRSLMGLVSLHEVHSFKALNTACATALSRNVWRLRDLRQLLARPTGVQTQLDFMEHHPLIRDLAEYGLFIRTHHE